MSTIHWKLSYLGHIGLFHRNIVSLTRLSSLIGSQFKQHYSQKRHI